MLTLSRLSEDLHREVITDLVLLEISGNKSLEC